jgi:hypothetical protein
MASLVEKCGHGWPLFDLSIMDDRKKPISHGRLLLDPCDHGRSQKSLTTDGRCLILAILEDRKNLSTTEGRCLILAITDDRKDS